MKSMIAVLGILSAVVAINIASADDLGTLQQALGEQCSVVSNYVESTDGCGSTMGDIQISATSSVEGGKTYDVEITVINELDEVSSAFVDNGVYYSRDDIYKADGVLWAPTFAGNYQVNLAVKNANTGTTVCAAQSMVIVK